MATSRVDLSVEHFRRQLIDELLKFGCPGSRGSQLPEDVIPRLGQIKGSTVAYKYPRHPERFKERDKRREVGSTADRQERYVEILWRREIGLRGRFGEPGRQRTQLCVAFHKDCALGKQQRSGFRGEMEFASDPAGQIAVERSRNPESLRGPGYSPNITPDVKDPGRCP